MSNEEYSCWNLLSIGYSDLNECGLIQLHDFIDLQKYSRFELSMFNLKKIEEQETIRLKNVTNMTKIVDECWNLVPIKTLCFSIEAD